MALLRGAAHGRAKSALGPYGRGGEEGNTEIIWHQPHNTVESHVPGMVMGAVVSRVDQMNTAPAEKPQHTVTSGLYIDHTIEWDRTLPKSSTNTNDGRFTPGRVPPCKQWRGVSSGKLLYHPFTWHFDGEAML